MFPLILQFVTSSAFSGYEVGGKLATDPTDFPAGKLEYAFRARVDGARWSIHVERIGDTGGQSGVRYYEDAFDGRFSYHYVQFVDNSSVRGVNTSHALVDTNNLPCEGSPLAPPIWLAFCSYSYLQSGYAHQMREIFDSGFETAPLTKRPRRFSCELHPSPPHLPISADFYSDGVSYRTDKQDKVQLSHFPVPFDKGFLSHSFKATAFTNAGGCWLPTQFEMQFLAPEGAGAVSSNQVRTVSVWRAIVMSVRPGWVGAEADFIPATDGATLTEDRRVPPIGETATRLAYLNTNKGQWVALSNKALINIHGALVRNELVLRHSRKGPSHPATRVVFGVMVAALVLLPLVAIRSANKPKKH